MSPFAWSDGYSVGNPEIDSHHRQLFGIFSRLFERAEDDDLRGIALLLAELAEYAAYHFRFEEECMRTAGCVDLERHICMHNYFSSRLQDIEERLAGGTAEACRELIFFLGNWLKHHVIEEDRRMTPSW